MEKVKQKQIYRGEIYYADLSPVKGSEQGGLRPVVIIQNDKGNKYSPTTIIAIITSRNTKAKLPTHYWIESWKDYHLSVPSMVELEQIRTIDKSRLKGCLSTMLGREMKNIDKAIKISLGLDN